MNNILKSNEVDFSKYRSFKTDVSIINDIFGGQIWMPQTFVLYGVPGVGKTTFLMQVCNEIQKIGLKVLYISGEQNLAMLAMMCDRLNIVLPINNNTDIDFILEIIKEYDFIIIDSLPMLTYDKSKYKFKKSEFTTYVISQIIKQVEKYCKCAGIILHSTKSGTYKGGSDITHLTDAQLFLNRENSQLNMNVVKNRFGPSGIKKLYMDGNGYDFAEYHILDNNMLNIPGLGNFKLL